MAVKKKVKKKVSSKSKKVKRKKKVERKVKKKKKKEKDGFIRDRQSLKTQHKQLRFMRNLVFVLIIVAIVVGFSLMILPNLYRSVNEVVDSTEEPELIEIEPIELQIKEPLLNSTQAVMYLPAVDEDGKGIITILSVEAIPGSGRTLVDIDNLLFWEDTQHSMRIAKNVAGEISGIDVNDYDIVYNIYANASIIGGGSAGAALTIATIAVMEDKELRDDVVITGAINHDGSIGPVHSILPKARAAKSQGATLFLVPLLQSRDIIYETREHCEKFGPSQICTTEQIPRRVDIGSEVDIEIKEVGTVKEAMEYFLKEK